MSERWTVNELAEWCAELDDRQLVLAAEELIRSRWPGDDMAASRDNALRAAVEIIMGSTSDAEIVDEWRAACVQEREAAERLVGAIVARRVAEPGLSEVKLAAEFGVNRITVRRAIGKPHTT